ncbi:AAA family ATPase [Acinetobacter indicus]|uniref:AAA family ATPase n=1 Tax=Acinetobacter indicus TaxID=756892 RepID=UPI00148E1DA4|nr:AAA family ATPase [Acinetobacter indicus]NOJ67252.1 ATP-binding protein [Acinetobacter indicus]
MERLVVKKFLLLQDIDIEIKKYNFLLGPQASGKSILAKLLYFFHKIPQLIQSNLDSDIIKEHILDNIKERFKTIFPENLWNNDVFEITYYLDDFSIKIGNKDTKTKSLDIVFCKKYSKTFDSILNIAKNSKIENRKKPLEDIIDDLSKSESPSNSSKIKLFIKDNEPLINFFEKSGSIFIPSSRCVYSLLAEKPATNSKTFSTDYFLNNFGELYENLKEFYEAFIVHNNLGEEFGIRAERILKGKYKYENKTDYIVANDKKINVKYVSSGQQEVLPLIVILGLYAILRYQGENPKKIEDKVFFIEEPEAHLFPQAQVEIMSLLSLVGHESQMPFFITTHSPYLLSILNSFLFGANMIKNNEISLQEFKEITNGARPIYTEEVNAFTIVNGVSESLMDEDGVLIRSDMLDNASTIVNNMFDGFFSKLN